MGNKIATIILKLLQWAFVLFMILISVFPVLYALLGAFKSNAELMAGNTILPQQWMFENFALAWSKYDFAHATFNSFYVAIFTTLGALLLSSMAGYVFARREFPGKKLIFNAYLATMFISIGAVTLKPTYLLMVSLGLHNSLWGVILMQIGAQGSNIFLVRQFVKGVPKELDEAAVIDGCGFFKIYWRVILPLIVPILGVVGLFAFRSSWNDYIMPNIFTMAKPALRTLSVVVVSMRYDSGAAAQWNIMLTGAALAILPMLVVYIFANKQFMSGLTVGAVKG